MIPLCAAGSQEETRAEDTIVSDPIEGRPTEIIRDFRAKKRLRFDEKSTDCDEKSTERERLAM